MDLLAVRSGPLFGVGMLLLGAPVTTLDPWLPRLPRARISVGRSWP